MYAKIKELADEAIKLQNKDRMDAVLREISGMCGSIKVVSGLAEYSGDIRALTTQDLESALDQIAATGVAAAKKAKPAKKATKK